MDDPTGLRNNYNTSPIKQPLAYYIANMLESGHTRHPALNHYMITPYIQPFLVDHLRATLAIVLNVYFFFNIIYCITELLL